jgi:hypothetical protein
LRAGKISVTKAIVEGQEKNRPKTNQDREITLCRRHCKFCTVSWISGNVWSRQDTLRTISFFSQL